MDNILKVKDEDLELHGVDAGGSPIYYYRDEPFTGYIVEHYPDGQLMSEEEYQNGYVEGVQRRYYENGQLKEEYYLKGNKLSRYFKRWDEGGTLLSENKYPS